MHSFEQVYSLSRSRISKGATLMNEMFKKAIADGASDIHIKSGDFVRARVDGDLTPLTDQ